MAPPGTCSGVPLAADDPSLARVLAEAKEASQERRKRELGVFLHEVSRRRDPWSCSWTTSTGPTHRASICWPTSGASARGCVRCWCSPTARRTLRSKHPFGPVKLELQGRGVCREIALPFLSRADFDRYLASWPLPGTSSRKNSRPSSTPGPRAIRSSWSICSATCATAE